MNAMLRLALSRSTVLAIFLLAATSWAGEVRHTVTFSLADLTIKELNGYSVPVLRGAVSTGDVGSPLLPLLCLNVLIPPTAEIRSVEVMSSCQTVLKGNYQVFPCQPPIPVGKEVCPEFVPPDPTIYSSGAPYPGSVVEAVPSGSQCGYRIAGILVHPLQYNPLKGTLTFYTRVELSIKWDEGRHDQQVISPAQAKLFGDKIRSILINPNDISRFAPRVMAQGEEVDYVIITPARLAPAWSPLIELRRRQGMNAIIMPVESIYENYLGSDKAAQVREFIRDYWRNRGLRWVVLGGQHDLLPVRYCMDTPTDLYFACLDWSWDSNHDGRYGDFWTRDSVDLLADVLLGRIPCDSAADIAAYINKDTIYELHPDSSYLKKLFLPWMAFDESWSARPGCENIKATMPRDWFVAIESVKTNLIRDSLNAGYHYMYYNGHGNATHFGYTFSTDDVPDLRNVDSHQPSIISSIACSCGEFDSADCMAAALINARHGGAVAAILNARFGTYWPGGMSAGEHYAIEFHRQCQIVPRIGVAQSNVKDRFAGLARQFWGYRWADYTLTSFFDPALPLWTQAPAIMAANFPESLPAGPQVVPVEVTSSGTAVGGATVTLMSHGQIISTGQSNSQGYVELPVSAASGDTLEVWIFAHDFLPVSGRIRVLAPTQGPAIVLGRVFVEDSANNRLDPGENVTVCVVLRNIGATSARLTGTLRTSCRYVLIQDSVADYGTLAPDDSAYGRFRVEVAPECPEGTSVEFRLTAQSSGHEWRPWFSLAVGLERLRGACWATLDTGGFLLSVTGLGAIGSTRHWGEGVGLLWPRYYGSRLALGSLAIGADSDYVCDWFYSSNYPANDTDFVMEDSIRPVLPPERADQEFIASYRDAGMPKPKGLLVTQRSLAFARRGLTDFAILEYQVTNTSSLPTGPIAVGLLADVCISGTLDDSLDFAGTDTARRLVYGTNFEDAFIGLALLSPDRLLGLSLIDGRTYRRSPGTMTDALKDSFLWGKKKLLAGMRRNDWAQVISAGPFTILPGQSQVVAFAVLVGHTPKELFAHCDTAQRW
ncbi:MAG: C25 family cysteine peptidase, partial [candidate division WOR-3 bacterium]